MGCWRGRYALANIQARPLCPTARPLAMHLAPGGPAFVAGLLANQVRQVLVADRQGGCGSR